MNITEPYKNIFLIEFDEQAEMCDALIRFQEYYESDVFAGSPFTLGELKRHLTQIQGRFRYYEDTQGMNIPSDALKPFIEGLFEPLTEDEEEIVETFRLKDEKFAIIGVYDVDEYDTLNHEYSHALYCTNPKYKVAVDKLLNKYPKKTFKGIRAHLEKTGYHRKVMQDEIHAFVSADFDSLVADKIYVPIELHLKLARLRLKYLKEIKNDK